MILEVVLQQRRVGQWAAVQPGSIPKTTSADADVTGAACSEKSQAAFPQKQSASEKSNHCEVRGRN